MSLRATPIGNGPVDLGRQVSDEQAEKMKIKFSNKHLYGPSAGIMLFAMVIIASEFNRFGICNSICLMLAGCICAYIFYRIRAKGTFLEIRESSIILVNNTIEFNDIMEIKITVSRSPESLENGLHFTCQTKSKEYKYSINESSLDADYKVVSGLIENLNCRCKNLV